MNKIFFRSAFCIVFVVLFTCLSAFADDKLWTEQDIKNHFSLSGFRNAVFVDASVVPTFSFDKFFNVNNLSVISNDNYPVVWQSINYQFASSPFIENEKQDTLRVNVPLYLENISSFNFTLFVCVYNRNTKNVYTSSNYNEYWSPVAVNLTGYDGASASYSSNVYYNGINYFVVNGAPSSGQRVAVRKYTISSQVPRGFNNRVRYLSLYVEFPFDKVFQDDKREVNVVIGLIPNEPTFILSNAQLGYVQDSLDDIQDELETNNEKLDDLISSIDTLNANVEEQTNRILYEVSPENQLVINRQGQRINEIKQQTGVLVDGLSQAEQFENADEVANITDPQSFLPDTFESDTGKVSEVLQNTFDNTPLETMMIISLSLALISYILFGKKGSA